MAEVEWIHQLLVLTTLPITGFAVLRHKKSKVLFSFLVPAMLGLGRLLTAGFVEALHDFETQLTIVEVVLLTSAHAWRWSRRTV